MSVHITLNCNQLYTYLPFAGLYCFKLAKLVTYISQSPVTSVAFMTYLGIKGIKSSLHSAGKINKTVLNLQPYVII